MAEETKEEVATTAGERVAEATKSGEALAQAVGSGVDSQAGDATGTEAGRRGRRAEKVGVVASDKMEKTCVVRVDRLVKHPKYRRYVRRTSKFMAHNERGATIGDKVRIVETRPLSARKRWRVVEIIQKAEK
jgi:small subunit ribosomal protein S17